MNKAVYGKMKSKENLIESTMSSEKVYHGALLHVYRDLALLPDKSSSVREWIKHPGASAVLPVTDSGQVVLIEQFRYPSKRIFIEVPAGKLDPNETPEYTAFREVQEEVGLIAKKLQYLGPYYPTIGYSDEVIHLYVAWELTPTNEQTDADEFVQPFTIPFKEAVDRALKGSIEDGKSMVTILRAWYWWQNNAPFFVDFS